MPEPILLKEEGDVRYVATSEDFESLTFMPLIFQFHFLKNNIEKELYIDIHAAYDEVRDDVILYTHIELNSSEDKEILGSIPSSAIHVTKQDFLEWFLSNSKSWFEFNNSRYIEYRTNLINQFSLALLNNGYWVANLVDTKKIPIAAFMIGDNALAVARIFEIREDRSYIRVNPLSGELTYLNNLLRDSNHPELYVRLLDGDYAYDFSIDEMHFTDNKTNHDNDRGGTILDHDGADMRVSFIARTPLIVNIPSNLEDQDAWNDCKFTILHKNDSTNELNRFQKLSDLDDLFI